MPRRVYVCDRFSVTSDLFELSLPEAPQDPEYLGCFADDKEDRVMTHKITMKGMTSAVCREHCSDKDALYYGTQVHICLILCRCIENSHRFCVALHTVDQQACDMNQTKKPNV